VYTDPGVYTVTLTASNSSGSSTASTQITVDAVTEPGGNLIGNPGFETSTEGWDTGGYSAVTLERVSGGHSGSWSAKLTNTGATSVTNTLNDAPNDVESLEPSGLNSTLAIEASIPGYPGYTRRTLVMRVGGRIGDRYDHKVITVIVNGPGLDKPVKKTSVISAF
jgi:PKD repeat protein